MKLYKISFELQSSIVTALKGDTIWGHFVWGLANHEGNEAVEEFLRLSESQNPPLIVSSAFPSGTLCMPLPMPSERKKNMSKADYSMIKKNKKRKYVTASAYITGINNKSDLGKMYEESTVMHNSINRYSNTVEDGNLYAVKESWPKQNLNIFDLYILSDYDMDRIIQLTKWAFENGYGADASTGRGKITILEESIQVISLKKSSGNRYMALAPFVSQSEKIKNLRADIFIRNGKIGGSFSGYMNPFKKTVVLFDEGAVFECDEPIQYIGNLIKDVHSDSRICQSGFAPVVPIGE